MEIRDFLIAGHELAHTPKATGAAIPNTEWPMSAKPWQSISEDQVRQTSDGHSSVAWLLWHMARGEDMAVNAIVRDVPEVLDRDGWPARLGIHLHHVGSGMSDEEAAELSSTINLGALEEYRNAVGRETRTWLETSDLSVLDRPIDEAAGRLAHAHDFLDPIMAWPEMYFPGRSGGWFLIRLALWHNFFHLGQMEHAMQQVGVNDNDRSRVFYGRSFNFP